MQRLRLKSKNNTDFFKINNNIIKLSYPWCKIIYLEKIDNFNDINYNKNIEYTLWQNFLGKYISNKYIYGQYFNSENYSPKTYNLKDFDKENINHNYGYFLKPNDGSEGKDIIYFSKVSELLEYIKKHNISYLNYMVQLGINPKLYLDKKFDFRIYYFIINHNNNIYSYYSKDGKVRISPYKYTINKKSYLTNSSQISNDDIKEHNIDINLCQKLFSQIYKDNLQNYTNKLHILIHKINNKIISLIKNNNKFNNKNFINLYGIDIMENINEEFNVIEINSNPNIYHKNDNNISSQFKKNTMNDISNIIDNVFYNNNIELLYWNKIN